MKSLKKEYRYFALGLLKTSGGGLFSVFSSDALASSACARILARIARLRGPVLACWKIESKEEEDEEDDELELEDQSNNYIMHTHCLKSRCPI